MCKPIDDLREDNEKDFASLTQTSKYEEKLKIKILTTYVLHILNSLTHVTHMMIQYTK